MLILALLPQPHKCPSDQNTAILDGMQEPDKNLLALHSLIQPTVMDLTVCGVPFKDFLSQG